MFIEAHAGRGYGTIVSVAYVTRIVESVTTSHIKNLSKREC